MGRLRYLGLRALAGDRNGATLVEFALVAPVVLLLAVGLIEIAMVIFVSTTIESAVFQASRYGITAGPVAPGVSREDRVLEIVERRTLGLVDMEDVDLETLIYSDFSNIGKPEPFTDENGNGRYDAGEPFVDVNGSGAWEADMGRAGLGGPGDVVLYRLTYDWGIMTPFMRGVLGEAVRNTSSVAVRNEPS